MINNKPYTLLTLKITTDHDLYIKNKFKVHNNYSACKQSFVFILGAGIKQFNRRFFITH